MTKLWVNGRASEDRDEWKEEVRTHCEKCYDDKIDTSGSGREGVLSDAKGESRRPPSEYGSVDRVLPARGKMVKNKTNGPADCLVTEMLQWFTNGDLCARSRLGSRSGSKVNAELQRHGRFYAWFFIKNTPRASWIPCDRTVYCVLQKSARRF